MRIPILILLACALFTSVGCYPVGHRYHDEETHQRHIEQMNNPNAPGQW